MGTPQGTGRDQESFPGRPEAVKKKGLMVGSSVRQGVPCRGGIRFQEAEESSQQGSAWGEVRVLLSWYVYGRQFK